MVVSIGKAPAAGRNEAVLQAKVAVGQLGLVGVAHYGQALVGVAGNLAGVRGHVLGLRVGVSRRDVKAVYKLLAQLRGERVLVALADVFEANYARIEEGKLAVGAVEGVEARASGGVYLAVVAAVSPT